MAVAGFSTLSHAQEFDFQKGDVLLEGSASLYTHGFKDDGSTKNTLLRLSPKVGFFVSDKVVLGLDLRYGTERSGDEDSYGGLRTSNRYDFGAFGRYYFLELGPRFKTYTELGATYGVERNSDNSARVDLNRFAANAGIGANFFLTPKVAIGYSLANLISYSVEKPDLPGAEDISRFRVSVNSFNNFFNAGAFSLTFKF